MSFYLSVAHRCKKGKESESVTVLVYCIAVVCLHTPDFGVSRSAICKEPAGLAPITFQTSTTSVMLAARDMLQHVPLVAFLDAYPEPAFILSSNMLPHSSLDFMYGNPTLRELLVGHDDTGILDDQVFFSALASDKDIVWLSDPTRTGSLVSVGESQTINVRPTWLPRDHAAIDLELTPTPVDLPMTIPGVGSATRSYVFTASPRRAPINLLRLDNHAEPGRRRDPAPHAHALPFPVSMGGRLYSRQTKSKSQSDSNSWPSQPPPASSVDLPSRLIDTFPWEKTSIGPREQWPVSLKIMVKYLMEKPIPSSIFWGWPDQVMIYNDPYAKMIGHMHPRIFGKPGPIGWGEMWDVLAPVSDLVRRGKPTFKNDDQLFFNSLTEMNLPEEVYHSWHWTPIWQEDGSVGGVWNTTWETTQKVIAERRLSGMSEIFSKLSDARTQEQFGERTLEALSRNPLDMPFVALYWCEVESAPADGSRSTQAGLPRAVNYLRHHLSHSLINVKLNLAGSIGIPDGHPIARPTIQYTLDPVTYCLIQATSDAIYEETSPGATTPRGENDGAASPLEAASNSTLANTTHTSILEMARIFASGTTELIDPLPPHLARSLDGRGFGDLPRAAAVLPISTNSTSPSSDRRTFPHAVLLLGLNTRRAYDADYAAWLESVGAGLSNQLTVVIQREADARMIEERERMDKAKTMFFTNVSHELRTPLTLIQAPLEQLVESHHLDGDVQYKLQLAMRNCKRLKKLINSIMDISKLEAGKLVGSFQPVQLGRVTADLAALFRSMAEKKGIEYRIVCDMADEPIVYVDIDLWEKIICNLLSNAFKYTAKGTISVSVTHDSAMARVSVRDTGVGIPKEYLDHVFERFFRVNNNTVEGTGVGLSLTKELVSLHGGQLILESQTQDDAPGNSGSVLTVSIPHGSGHLPPALIQDTVRTHASHKERDYWVELEQPTPSTSTSSEEEESVASSTFFFEKDDTILVVDNNADMRAYVSKVFTPYLTVLEARDGIEALQIAKTQKLNLVLCDVMMPKMDGPELLQRLREEQRTKILPVIFVTASEDTSLIGGRAEGAVDCISKPFRVRDLLARVHLQLQIGKRRIKLEEDFEVRSHQLQVLTEQSPVGIFRTDVNGKLTYLNRVWYQITGFPPEQDRDQWLEHLDTDTGSKEDAIRIWRACFEEYKSATVRLQWKNDVWTHCCIVPLMSPEGFFLGAFGTVTDVNEQSRLEEARIALAEEREQIAASRAEEAEAQRQLEVERRRAQELLIDVTSHELRQPVSAIIQNAEVVRTNMRRLRELMRDCKQQNTSYTPTERMLNELDEDLQAMDSIIQCGLAQARIANDVLSLSRIQLNVLPIIPTEFDIRKETNQILMVFRNELTAKEINFELDLGRGAEMFGLQTVSTDRSRYAQVITNLMSNAIRFTDMSTCLREIRVSLELSPDPPLDGSCAPPPLIPGRHVLARSLMYESDEIPVYIYVSVQDSGPGLQKEDLALLFQRFQQGSNAHHVFGGSGLGLFVCRQLCTLMDGQIEVVSEPGEGAMFRFFIQAYASSGRNPQPPAPGFRIGRSRSLHSKASGISKTSVRSGSRPLPETPNLHHNRALHVLITEDNKINQTVLARQMKSAGFTVILASNGLEAIQAIEKSESQTNNGSTTQMFDVVLMDLEMPVLDGFEATREIRRRESVGTLRTHSFIIALTGNARLEQVQAARDAGVDDVMIKPYQIDALISKMRAGCQHKPE